MQPVSPTIEEDRRHLEVMLNHVMTPEEEAEYRRLLDSFDSIQIDSSELPTDYIDEIDHYLYGTPKRGENK